MKMRKDGGRVGACCSEHAWRGACGEYSWRLIRAALSANDIHWHRSEMRHTVSTLALPCLFLSHIWLISSLAVLWRCFVHSRLVHAGIFFWSLCCCMFNRDKKSYMSSYGLLADRQSTVGFQQTAAVLCQLGWWWTCQYCWDVVISAYRCVSFEDAHYCKQTCYWYWSSA